MKVTNAQTGKTRKGSVGQAFCGESFSKIIFEAGDLDYIKGSEIERKNFLRWLEHALFVRLNTAEIQKRCLKK